MKEFLTTAEVGERLGVTAQRVADLANAGRIPFVRHGRCIRVPARAWERFLREQEQEAMAALKGVPHAQAA